MLRWLAITAARGAFTGELADWNGLTPVFVKLREYSGRELPRPEAMLDSVAGQITGVMPKAWVERRLADGRALLLVDGVDELLDGERRGVLGWLRRLLTAYGDVRVVVTSRPRGGTCRLAAPARGSRRCTWTAWPRRTSRPFVRQWHRAVRQLGDDLPCAVEELPRYEQSLLTSLKDRPASSVPGGHSAAGGDAVRDAPEPRPANSPATGWSCTANALHTLVHERDTDRNVPSAVDGRLSLSDKLVLLRDLAWRLSDNNRSEIGLEQAAVHVGRKLSGMRHVEEQDGVRILEQLRDRSGILRSPAEGRLDFVHRTFQEYLAAEEATQEDRVGNLVERAHLDLWRETIIMAAGHANRPQREELLGGVLDRARDEPRYGRKLRLLAAACQETVPEVSDGLAGRLQDAVTALLPPSRRTDPPALAAVGPSLLRRLPRSLAGLTSNAAVQTVRTAALIGGGEALGLLEGYAQDRRRDVVAALIDAWAYFDADAYAERVMDGLPLHQHAVVLTHSAQLSAAARLRSLTTLRITFGLHDMSVLAGLPPLEELTCQVRGTADLSPLKGHPGLKELQLFGEVSFRHPEVLAELPALRLLRLPLPGPDGAEGLPVLPELPCLSLAGVTARTRLDFLTAYGAVELLCLVGEPHGPLPRLAPLSSLTGLRTLMLYSFEARDLSERLVPVCPELNTLGLYDCLLPDGLDGLRALAGLRWLELQDCDPDEGRLTGLDLPGVTVTVD
ncbi:hypothetical protein GCM10017687_51960 [Streptomyces echinatus]|uniref:NACHT domain-containing protein n=1 Tax=Streptomyces echinatus TaxID=67293 RepID=UPI0031EF1701